MLPFCAWSVSAVYSKYASQLGWVDLAASQSRGSVDDYLYRQQNENSTRQEQRATPVSLIIVNVAGLLAGEDWVGERPGSKLCHLHNSKMPMNGSSSRWETVHQGRIESNVTYPIR